MSNLEHKKHIDCRESCVTEVDIKRDMEGLGSRVAVMKTARIDSEGDVTTLTSVLHKTAWDRAALEKDKMLQVG